jgi:sorting nexin-13
MSTQRQVIVRDLMDEGKKRIVVLVICVVGLSYLMSCKFSSLSLCVYFEFVIV